MKAHTLPLTWTYSFIPFNESPTSYFSILHEKIIKEKHNLQMEMVANTNTFRLDKNVSHRQWYR